MITPMRAVAGIATTAGFHSAPLLAAAALCSAGAAWGAAAVLWSCPWLLLVLAGCSIAALHLSVCIFHGGLLTVVPEAFGLRRALRSPSHEVLRTVWDNLALEGCKWARLVMLACVELDDKQRAQIFAELDADFRERAFTRPSFEMLPSWVQSVLLGLHGELGEDAEGVSPLGGAGAERAASRLCKQLSRRPVPERLPCANPDEGGIPSPPHESSQASTTGTQAHTSSASSVDHLVAVLRGVERSAVAGRAPATSPGGAWRSAGGGPAGGHAALQRVFTEKVADVTVKAILQGGTYQVTSSVPSIWRRSVELVRSLRKVGSFADGPLSRMWTAAWVVVACVFRGLAPVMLQEQLLHELVDDFRVRAVGRGVADDAASQDSVRDGEVAGGAVDMAVVPEEGLRRRVA